MNSLNFRRLKGIPEWPDREVSDNCSQSTKRGYRWIWQVERRTRKTDSRMRINRLEKWPNPSFKWLGELRTKLSLYIFQFILQLSLLYFHHFDYFIQSEGNQVNLWAKEMHIKTFKNLKAKTLAFFQIPIIAIIFKNFPWMSWISGEWSAGTSSEGIHRNEDVDEAAEWGIAEENQRVAGEIRRWVREMENSLYFE